MKTLTYKIKDLTGKVTNNEGKKTVTVQYRGYTHTMSFFNDRRSNFKLVLLVGYVLLKSITNVKNA